MGTSMSLSNEGLYLSRDMEGFKKVQKLDESLSKLLAQGLHV